ncbi:regulatory protein, FmdB family [Desulfatibacillum aliphaticivorans]|uniref:Regulatory protein, FmdB family n=1 Tax=Desulfatibacillum aliphaticivorans TaxID=218208 RepID=B8FN29_DESAL|nr:zinc ribbon domain-containing protein [Desulfatibacillum aliphaticivorans]ACL05899.1 regulatory protein, FmdB family [Desulfatibacillum aliphaticivorans]
MAIYEYEHLGEPCGRGAVFEVVQSMRENPLTRCPDCGGPVRKIISRTNINTPKTDSELKDLGFTKLVRRDNGVYENVTARPGENKYMEAGKPETIPDFSKTIGD